MQILLFKVCSWPLYCFSTETECLWLNFKVFFAVKHTQAVGVIFFPRAYIVQFLTSHKYFSEYKEIENVEEISICGWYECLYWGWLFHALYDEAYINTKIDGAMFDSWYLNCNIPVLCGSVVEWIILYLSNHKESASSMLRLI